jgi:WD40 repeat protein
MSLFCDHLCDRNQFPLQTILELSQVDEVWWLEFSHNGKWLATSGQDSTVLIYDTETFDIKLKLASHSKDVAYATWSPDDTKLITCSHDNTAKGWNTTVCQIRAASFPRWLLT